MARAARVTEKSGHTSVVALETAPGVPAIDVFRFDRTAGELLPAPHAHAFLGIGFFEDDGGVVRSAGREWRLRAGDALIVAPGEVYDVAGLADATGWTAFFRPDALGSHGTGPLLSWRSHPLLFAFTTSAVKPPRHLIVPPRERAWWSSRFVELHRELNDQLDGYGPAALANLTLLLVATGRLTADVVGDLRINDEPLLAAVFQIIESRYAESLSLGTVADALSLTPGHLTTVVRRKTGKTVQGWIAERRMAEARRLLTETDLSVAEISDRVGFVDAPYFVRSFKRRESLTPLVWRRTARGA